MRFGAQEPSAGFELPSNLAVVVEPYGPRPARTPPRKDDALIQAYSTASFNDLKGDDTAARGLSQLSVNNAPKLVIHQATVLEASNSADVFDVVDDDDGGVAWFAENPVGQRDPRDSGEEDEVGDDPVEDWVVRRAGPPESKESPAAAVTPLLLEEEPSLAQASPQQVNELNLLPANMAPVEASSLAIVNTKESKLSGGVDGKHNDGGIDEVHNQPSQAAWEGPEHAWPLPGDTSGTAARQLTMVDLSRCSLRGFLHQSPLSQLGNTLTTLLLDGNALEGPLAGACTSQLVHLTALEHLSLSQNLLSGPLPSELCKLYKSLRVLNLGSNRLLGPIPSEWVYFEDKLEELSLFDNAGVDSLRDSWLADRLPLCLIHL